MKKKSLKRILGIVLACSMVMSLCFVTASAAEGDESEGEAAEGEMDMGGEMSSGSSASVVISISDGVRNNDNELSESDIDELIGTIDPDSTTISGIKVTVNSLSAGFASITASVNVDPANGDDYTAVIGSDDEVYDAPVIANLFDGVEGAEVESYEGVSGLNFETGEYTATTEAGQELLSSLLNEDTMYSNYITMGSSDSDSGRGSNALSVSGGAAVLLKNTYLYSEGAERVAVQNSGSGDTKPILVVQDSLLISKGYVTATVANDENLPNDPLLVTGATRTNFSGGQSETYYYDSVVIVDGWASLSTDSSSDEGVDLIAVGTFASALLGGYGTYADYNCRDYLYGSVLEGAELGIIIACDGEVYVFDGDEGFEGGEGYNVGANADIDPYLYADEDADYSDLGASTIAGGRNAVMIHLPYSTVEAASEYTQAIFYAKDSTLITDSNLLSLDDDYYGEELSANIQKYVDYTTGDLILIKGNNANITLDNVTVESENGVIIHSVLNNDTSGQTVYADEEVLGTDVTLANMDVEGDILDEDYEREMRIVLDATTLTGKIFSGTDETWTSYWIENGYVDDYTYGYASNSFGEEIALDTFVHNISITVDEDYNVVDYEVTDYGTVKGTTLTLTNGSVWNVDEDSTLTSISVDETSCIIIPEGVTLTVGEETYTNGTITSSGFASSEAVEDEDVVGDVIEDEEDTEAAEDAEDASEEAVDAEAGDSADASSADTTSDDGSVAVGDSFNMGLWIALGILALCGGAVLVIRRIRA